MTLEAALEASGSVSVRGDDVSMLGSLGDDVVTSLLALVELVAEVVLDGISCLLKLLVGVLDDALSGAALLGSLADTLGEIEAVGTVVSSEGIRACIDSGLGDDAIKGTEGAKVLACGIGFGSEGVEDLILVGDKTSYEISLP